jgi:hypothetical protein
MEKEIQKNEKNLAEEKLQQEICYDEDEIDLYELWLTIKKRKNVIIGLFLFSVIATAVISFTCFCKQKSPWKFSWTCCNGWCFCRWR